MFYQCRFTPEGWCQDDWLLVRSPRWEARSSWCQEEDHIINVFPDDLDPAETQMGRDRTGETYLSMLYKKPVKGSCRVETTCAFLERMAPLIVFSRELAPVHKEHLEVVLFDRGINLWHHFFNDGIPSWKLIGFWNMALEAGKPHRLVAEMRHTSKGKFLCMGVDQPTFGTRLAEDWPDECFAGITACEGHNRFYDFQIGDEESTPVMRERISD
ncbi:MAG: hypothetical protein IKC65_01010 [Lentisphaeria bacterium]|nr:hypothetical protein [Lentisphaeria bacterium]